MDSDTDIKTWRIPRDGDRDLRFRGVLLGEGEHGTGGTSGYKCDWTRGVSVRIYRTDGGKYVHRVKWWSLWQGEGEKWEVRVYASPRALLDGMMQSDDGELRPADKEAWEAACNKDEALSALECEEIE